MQPLDGLTAIVTGASSGIGRGIAMELASAGATVVACARRLEPMEDLRDHGDVHVMRCDVTDEDQVAALFAEVAARHGSPGLLVNNAGIADATRTEDLSLDRWREVLDVNLTSAFLCSRAAIRLMKPAGGGRIVNIGSLSASIPRAGSPAYTVSKFGLEGLTRQIALDGRDDLITCSILHPGSTRSNLAPGHTDVLERDCLQPEQIGRFVVYLAGLPPDVALLDATLLPVRVPYLGRG